MKRKVAVLLICAMVMTSVGCSSGRRSSRDDDDEETVETEETEETEDSVGSDESGTTPAHTEKSEPETSASSDTAETSGASSGDMTIADMIGTVEDGKYVSEYTGVSYTAPVGTTFGDRATLQTSFGAVDINAKVSEASMMVPIAGTYVMWPDGSNLSVSYQINPLYTAELHQTFLEANKTSSESAIKNIGYDVDRSEVSTVTINGKTYDTIEIDSHNSNGDKVNQVMILTSHNGVVIFITSTSVGMYTADEMFKGLELP